MLCGNRINSRNVMLRRNLSHSEILDMALIDLFLLHYRIAKTGLSLARPNCSYVRTGVMYLCCFTFGMCAVYDVELKNDIMQLS